MHHRGGGGANPGVGGPNSETHTHSNGFGNMGSIPLSPKSLARVGFGAYGDKFLGAGSAFVSDNYAKYFSSAKTRAYFDVTEAYVFNKLKLILCPFLHRGSWARVPEHGGVGTNAYDVSTQGHPGGSGGMGAYPDDRNRQGGRFRPPSSDINAPDLYLPLMGFWSYVLTASALQAQKGTFTPESVATHASWGAMCWFFEAVAVWAALRSLSTSRVKVAAPWLDVAAYTGYAFVLVSVSLCIRFIFPDLSTLAMTLQTLWASTCSAVFIVKTMKRVIFSEARQHQHGFESVGASNYALLALAFAQVPMHWGLGRIV